LLVASAYFYAALNPVYLVLLAGVTLIAYAGALALNDARILARQRKLVLALAVLVELGILFAFKYVDFFTASVHALFTSVGVANASEVPAAVAWLVPAGLSFYTFSSVSYLVDVYRQIIPAERHLGRLALYVSFFPKLLAGPIERAGSFLPQLGARVHFDPDQVTYGLQLMLFGLFKKVVIADRLATFVDSAYQTPAFASPVDLILGTYFFAFQIYCDFSGYTDIARGAARVLGFSLMENFRRPYLSTSIVEFWGGRWHISLTRWFRDYLFIPLGGSRVGPLRRYFNAFAVFSVSGLWHGANWTFVIWGALNGAYYVLYLLMAPIRQAIGSRVPVPQPVKGVLATLLTFHLVLLSWVFFRAASLSDAVTLFTQVGQAVPRLPTLFVNYPYTPDLLLSFGLIALLLLVELVDERRPTLEWVRSRPVYVRWAAYYACLGGLLVLGNWNLSKFVYMQF
jgi:D-alanyl-lipoteichoic acid acyltransferase DltB (MBOAT superfamily)